MKPRHDASSDDAVNAYRVLNESSPNHTLQCKGEGIIYYRDLGFNRACTPRSCDHNLFVSLSPATDSREDELSLLPIPRIGREARRLGAALLGGTDSRLVGISDDGGVLSSLPMIGNCVRSGRCKRGRKGGASSVRTPEFVALYPGLGRRSCLARL